MRIKSLHITGFKSLRDVTWEPGALNVVIGPNGSGKSNLLTALELLSASAQGRLAKFIQRLGGMWSIVWDGQADNIFFALEFANGDELENVKYLYSIGISYFKSSSKTWVEQESLSVAKDGSQDFIYKRDMSKDYDGKDCVRYYDIEGNIKQLDISSEVEAALSEMSTYMSGGYIIKKTKGLFYNSSLHHIINTSSESIIRIPPQARYEKRVESDGQNLVTVLHTLYSEDRQFKKDIHAAMQAAFGDDFEELVFPPAADQRVQLRIRWKSLKREQSLGDISDGTLRFLFLMTVLAAPDPAPLIAIDEPETGLHPSMFPIIAEYAAQAAKKTQVVFTTHSPQFLDACGPFLPTVTVTGWKNGETTLKNLDGELLKQWLADYSLGKMFESGDLEALA